MPRFHHRWDTNFHHEPQRALRGQAAKEHLRRLGRVDIYRNQSKDAVSATKEPNRDANLS
jgi:hypothetical protein